MPPQTPNNFPKKHSAPLRHGGTKAWGYLGHEGTGHQDMGHEGMGLKAWGHQDMGHQGMGSSRHGA